MDKIKLLILGYADQNPHVIGFVTIVALVALLIFIHSKAPKNDEF